VGSVAAASVLAVAAGTVIRNPVEALAAATGVLFVPPPLAVLLSPAPVCLNAKRRRRRPGRPTTAQPRPAQPARRSLLLVAYAAVSMVGATAVRRRDVD
jgi:hypothetical protein